MINGEAEPQKGKEEHSEGVCQFLRRVEVRIEESAGVEAIAELGCVTAH